MDPKLPLEEAHALPVAAVVAQLATDPVRGLSAAEAQSRLAQVGRNELPAAPPVPWWRKLLAQFESPLVLLLVAAGGISLGVWWFEGHHGGPYEALTIFAIVVANAILGFVQEERAEHAVASLAKMTAAPARSSCATASASPSRRRSWCRATWWWSRRAPRSRPTRA